jgi:hypothetical protein
MQPVDDELIGKADALFERLGKRADCIAEAAMALELKVAAATRLVELLKERDEARNALEPYANYNGPLPDYDDPLRPVFESGIQYTVELLAKELGVEDWEVCDGTEEFDGDLGGTLLNIVIKTWPTDEHGDWLDFRDPNVRDEARNRVEKLTNAGAIFADAANTYEAEGCDDDKLLYFTLGELKEFRAALTEKHNG